MNRATWTTLGEICADGGGFVRTGPFGAQLHRSDYIEDRCGVPVVMPKDMADGRIDMTGVARVSEATADRLHDHLMAVGDIALARRGDVGRSAWVGSEDLPVLCGTGSMRVHPGAPSSVLPDFLRYYLRSCHAATYLANHAIGATMPNLNAATVAAMPVPVLPNGLQRLAAGTLGAIDDLIENNRQRVEVLEEMARAIYRKWFVHFRFPGHEDATFVDSPVGPVPDGWSVKPFAEVAELDRTNVRPDRQPAEVFDHYSIPAFDSACLPEPELGFTIRSSKYLITAPAVLVSKLNPRIERTWFVKPALQPRSVASTEFLVLRPATHLSLGMLYLMVRSEPFQERLQALSGGTSTSHQRVKPADFMKLLVVEPPQALAARLDGLARPGLELAHNLRVATHSLAALRDLLLPKLVTGEIDVLSLDLDRLVGEQPSNIEILRDLPSIDPNPEAVVAPLHEG